MWSQSLLDNSLKSLLVFVNSCARICGQDSIGDTKAINYTHIIHLIDVLISTCEWSSTSDVPETDVTQDDQMTTNQL